MARNIFFFRKKYLKNLLNGLEICYHIILNLHWILHSSFSQVIISQMLNHSMNTVIGGSFTSVIESRIAILFPVRWHSSNIGNKSSPIDTNAVISVWAYSPGWKVRNSNNWRPVIFDKSCFDIIRIQKLFYAEPYPPNTLSTKAKHAINLLISA